MFDYKNPSFQPKQQEILQDSTALAMMYPYMKKIQESVQF
jgi:hypothetical protein